MMYRFDRSPVAEFAKNSVHQSLCSGYFVNFVNGIAILLALFLTQSLQAAELDSFLKEYCIRCHGEEKQKADRRFDKLGADLTDIDTAEHYQEILDQLNLAEMPPDDEPQPSDERLQQIVAYLTTELAKAREAATENSGQIVMRRLNRNEYLNTIRDLFSLSMVDFDPTVTFPEDESVEGFDNNGEGLVTSDYLLQNYLEAARKVADKAIRPGPEPEKIHLHVEGEEIHGKGHASRPEIARVLIKDRQPLGIGSLLKRRIREDGEYVIRIRAKAHNRKSRYADEHLRYNSDEPMRMSISIASKELGKTSHRVVKEFDVPDDQPVDFEHRLWLEEGFAFQVHWANGPNGSTKRILRKVLPKYTDDAIYPLRNPVEMYAGSGPELHVYSIEIEGPFFEQWPLPGFERFFPSPPQKPDLSYLNESMKRLATRAFRRPIDDETLAPYLALTERYYQQSGDFWAAAKYGIRAILTSPHFLYQVEDNDSKTLTSWELASRLSYFLWSSMPDDPLFAAAADSSILDPEVLRSQALRMLKDSKSEAFTNNFAGQWLHLRKLGEMPPDPTANAAYYKENLEAAMKQETLQFFSNLLSQNGSLLDFIDSDYTYLNQPLAKHYGIAGVEGEVLQRVSLPANASRGGLLGQASILTLTSNGVETQPVVRGVWMLENLFGTPPNPPPPDIEPLEPDTRGVTTIRELMVKHREDTTCNECHRKIDPLGLGLENYDHLGRWRDRYYKKAPIDASGTLHDGTEFSGPSGLKQYLLDRPEQFTHCLAEKLMIYALGRRISFTDRDDIDSIVNEVSASGYGLQDLVLAIIESEPFRAK